MKRLVDDWMLLVGVFIGFVIATTLAAGTPLYLSSLDRLAFGGGLNSLSSPVLDVTIFASHISLTTRSIQHAEQAVSEAVDRGISPAYLERQRYLKSGTYLVGLPQQPLPREGARRILVSRGYFQHLTGLEQHSRFIEGRMARGDASAGPQGPQVEAVVGTATAEKFNLGLDDMIFLTPSIGNATVVMARIVGVVEPADRGDRYWNNAGIFLDPEPLTESPQVGVQVRPDEPPVALFVSEGALVDGVGQAYPGTLVRPIWFLAIDKVRIKGWSFSDTRLRFKEFEDHIVTTMPGSSVSASFIGGLIENIERRSLFTRVPLLLLLAVLAVTVLFYLYMVVSNLAQDRERDAALLKTRGVGTLQVMRLYSLEGLVMAVVAVLLAPFLAIGLVALAGVLPYFSDITGGGLLPVELGPAPFLMATGAGLVCLAIYVVPSVLGARGGLLAHKLRASRPPTLPFFHRYYMDVAVLVLGGLAFWELSSRGQFISGGLFQEQGVNEKLLLAPVLFLIVVALVFIRFFPLVVRFMNGESPALLHLTFAVTLLVLGPGIALRETREGIGSEWLGPVALLVALAWAYWATHRTGRRAFRACGLVLQAGLVAGVVALERPEAGEALFAPTVVLMAMVPAQVAYLLLRVLTRKSPVWLSVGMWHMARNPLQYTWLVLLLVLVTGVGILSTTVGGTLARSQEQRVRYDIAADIRVSGVSRLLPGGIRGIKERYINTPGIAAGSLGLRTNGSVGHSNIRVLALESREFPFISWYRDDFSASSLAEVMGTLQPDLLAERLAIPEGATSIGVWVKPEKPFTFLSLWMVLSDRSGAMRTLTLGDVGPLEWELMTAEIPPSLEPPLHLVSVQVFEPGTRRALTPGTLLLDDIHVSVGPANEQHILEDFEGPMPWRMIPTSLLTSDSISATSLDTYRGDRAGAFKFGISSNRSIRGFYWNTGVGSVPVVASSLFIEETGKELGDSFIASVAGRMTPVVIRDTVELFPTMSPYGTGFLLADLDALLGYVNMMGQPSRVEPNELFLKKTSVAHPAVGVLADELARELITVDDGESSLESVRLDTLAMTGWRAMVLVSLAIVLLAAAFGYGSYLLLYADTNRREVGFLQSLGLSRRQLAGLLGFEHLTIAAIGLGLGTWAGFEMSGLIVSQLAIGDTGQQVVPPLVLEMDWSLMLPTYVLLVGVFLGAQLLLNRSVGRMDLTAIARASE